MANNRKPPPNDSPIDEETALRVLKDKGYKIRRPSASYKKHTFEIDEHTYKTFRIIQENKAVLLKDAMNEAMLDWCEKNKRYVK